MMLSIEGGPFFMVHGGGSVRDDVRAQSAKPSGIDPENVLCCR